MPKIKDIRAYITGHIRYYLWYSKFYPLIPKYIREQITARIASMDEDCYNEGYCKMCGCQTTALQMANKSCTGGCYPTMLVKKDWKELKQKGNKTINNHKWYLVDNFFCVKNEE